MFTDVWPLSASLCLCSHRTTCLASFSGFNWSLGSRYMSPFPPRVSPRHVCSELPHMHTGSPCSPPGDHTESYSRGAPAILAPDGARIRPQMVLSVTEQRIRGCSISLVQPHHNGAVSLPGYQVEMWPAASLAEVRIRPMGRKKTVDDNPLIRFSAAVLPFASGRSLNLRHPVSSLYCLCSFISPIGSERAWS